MTQLPIPCAVLVLVRNAAATIGPCLEGLREFQRVIVLDGFSTDATREIAAGFSNVHIVDQDRAYLDENGMIKDFGAMRNVGLRHVTEEWFLYIDSDEILTPALIASIRTATASSDADAYEVFRRFVVDGHPILRSAVYPATHVRLARRSAIECFVKPIHERFKLASSARAAMLDGDLLIPLPSAKVLWPKYKRYLAIEADRSANMGLGAWVKWIFLRNVRSAMGVSARMALVWIMPGTGRRLPFAYEAQFVAYSLCMIVKTFPLGKRRHART